MFCRKVCWVFSIVICALLVGCNSAGRIKHSCSILLESCNEACSQVVTLPVSCVDVAVAPVPLFTEQDIAKISLRNCAYGCVLAMSLTDHAAYEMYKLSLEAVGRKLLFECDGAIVGFSVIDDAADVHEIVFIPEISDENCFNLFGYGRK
ncbi:MAG: hypothetical protein LBF94_03135 [Puniceicoccales bacterium]|nr:hypothetical protein [Puniceicoccales bacterium]